VRASAAIGDPQGMSVHILEIKYVAQRGVGAVGYGIDEEGREFAVALDTALAAEIAAGIDCGRRPIVAVERPLYPEEIPAPAVLAKVVAKLHARGTLDRPSLDVLPG
jgi:hypothetical protein